MRLSILLAALIAVSALRAQDAGCPSCNGTGTRECANHKATLDAEKAALACSEAAKCKQCAGALAKDCVGCVNPLTDADLSKRREAVASWLAQRRKDVDEVTGGKEIMHLRTATLELAFSVRPLTVGRVKLDTHALMHLYAQRIETLRGLFLTTFGLTDKVFTGPLRIYLFKDQIDHRKLAPRVTGQGANSNGVKLMGADSVYCAHHNPQTMPGDEELHRNVVHNVTHLLLSNAEPTSWLGNRKCGWVDEGVAHWFEDKITAKCTNFCYEEVALQPGAGFKGGRWRVPVRKLVEAGKLGGFARLSTLNTDELTFEDHAHAFACVDFLLATKGGPALWKVIASLKRGTALRDALKEGCGLNVLSFDAELQTWIKANYPLEEVVR